MWKIGPKPFISCTLTIYPIFFFFKSLFLAMLRQIAGFGMLYALESVFLMKQNDLYFYKHLVMSDLCCVNNKA